MSVYRIYVEKKPEYAVEAQSVLSDLQTALRVSVTGVRVFNRYDADKLTEEAFEKAIPTVFSEPAVDYVYKELPALSGSQRMFAMEYLPGQFDQRADSCEQCIQILLQGERCRVRSAQIYMIIGNITDAEFEKVKAYLINPVERREAAMELPESLDANYEIPTTVETLTGFIDLTAAELNQFVKNYGLAMDLGDIKFCQEYFRDTEHRDPTITEIRMIDTYWSDHCRHTTFLTNIEKADIETPYIKETYDEYLRIRGELGREAKPITLMDMATLAVRKLKADGKLNDLDESEEINACSVKIKVDIDGREEDWILMFKNETHNHPTEIEPFGGAATCLGGAIRDPLSGRSYVYQAMRVTGAANPLVPVADTISGKLPQRKITQGAANGYSSYGNQIGLATGHVAEVYHPGYMAKRMEIGAVLGAAPAANIRREAPAPGDVVILLGGKTGRDGCGGATGSSKSHTIESLESCGAEVQKGNAPEERKLQRLFRNPFVTQMIKRCNDFGAGGVSVAIGELTDGLEIDLNAVPKKYEGLDGTEIAISESQERMAVVVSEHEADRFLREAAKENLEATIVAVVKEEPRLRMKWNGNTIVDLSREFLNSNGAAKYTDIVIDTPKVAAVNAMEDCAESWTDLLSNLNVCSQKGLIEKFDSTIGAGTVLMPFGGVHQLSPSQAMAAKIPVLRGETNTCSLMGWGFNPLISENSPYHGAMCAVVSSVAKVVAAGGSWHHCWLTFQEYFERTQNNPKRWGKPMAALLGAFKAQLELSCGSIGGKDSMSGTFENIDVPPTLVSFAVSTAKADKVVSTEFKKAGSTVIQIRPQYDENGLPVFESIRACFDRLEKIIADGRAAAVWAVDFGGVAEGIAKMAFGNRIGFAFSKKLSAEELFQPCAGAFVIELTDAAQEGEEVIGTTTEAKTIAASGYTLNLEELISVWEKKLEPVFPCRIQTTTEVPPTYSFSRTETLTAGIKEARPRVLIPVFPGTNCEYDTARIFERAGARAEVFVIKNLSAAAIEESIDTFAMLIKNSQIIMIPGGFSGGDEPDGSGKFITAFFRNPKIRDAVHNMLKNRDGLMLGICNGFQALVKLGLVPYGEIVDMKDNSPTLTFNTIARHQSMLVNTRIASNKSPWLYGCKPGDVHTVAISHGEGRFVAPQSLIDQLAANGQIATQYVDGNGIPSMDIHFNPNTSMAA
ncbi:MAG: phosphoribosylformylglycinamidine synthase, partial [Ruminococcus sp.]|nr:phosphoribosylformylglycinamidine synthase [Ruminococcus sp.]